MNIVKFLLRSITLVLLPLTVSSQNTVEGTELGDKWHFFKSDDGKFEVQVPGVFIEKADSLATPLGDLVYHTAFFQQEKPNADNLFYMVSYCDYPEGSIHSDSLELLSDFFATTMESAAGSVMGRLVYADPIQMDQFPGWQWRIDYLEDQVVIKTRAFVVKRRYYAIQTIMYKNKNLNRSASRFFESFRLLE